MIDGLAETPRVAVKLARTQDWVEVTVPFLDGRDDVYQYWFSGGIMYGDDPGKVKRRYKPPNSITFYDTNGVVGLVGSHATGSRRNLGGTGIGEGRLAFDYTVLGANSGESYENINGLRSEVEGLGTWIGLRSLEADQEFKDGRLAGVNLRLQSSPPVRAARALNAEFRANWRYGPGPAPDQTTISERMQVHTQVIRPRSWEDHFKVHFPLRNLLRLATWRALNFVSHDVMSTSDPLRTLDGNAHGEQWFPVITGLTGITERPTTLNRKDFLFSFGDVEPRGVGRWIQLSAKFDRGVTPLLGLLDLAGASLEAHLAQAGIAYEMLGYDILLESGLSRRRAGSAKFVELAGAVSSAVAHILPFSATEFPELLRRTYSGVKHADLAKPDIDEMHLAYNQAIQVFRAWVALRLGVPPDKLRASLDRDPVTRRIQAIQRHASV